MTENWRLRRRREGTSQPLVGANQSVRVFGAGSAIFAESVRKPWLPQERPTRAPLAPRRRSRRSLVSEVDPAAAARPAQNNRKVVHKFRPDRGAYPGLAISIPPTDRFPCQPRRFSPQASSSVPASMPCCLVSSLPGCLLSLAATEASDQADLPGPRFTGACHTLRFPAQPGRRVDHLGPRSYRYGGRTGDYIDHLTVKGVGT